METFVSVEEARTSILNGLSRLGTERVSVTESVGRVLGEPIVAPEASPPFDNSSRDGFAFRWSDVAGTDASDRVLDVVGTIHAGQSPDFDIDQGQAASIMTGAPVPGGADTVVMQEQCEWDDQSDTLRIEALPESGRGSWIRKAGAFMESGEPVLDEGTPVGGAEIGLMVTFQRTMIEVSRRPVVTIVSTGDELVEPDHQPGPGQIVNSNAYQLRALCEDAGATAHVLPVAPDDYDEVESAFQSAVASSDLVVSSGGVSVGAHDVTRDVVESLTGSMTFWKVRMKPGKPLAFGQTQDQRIPLIGLPGNPASCFVGFHQFVKPAIGWMQGRDVADLQPDMLEAVLGRDVNSTPHRREYLSGTVIFRHGEKPEFIPVDNQNSGNVSLFCEATAFGLVEEGIDHLMAGDTLDVELID